jgi:hypothetical protein
MYIRACGVRDEMERRSSRVIDEREEGKSEGWTGEMMRGGRRGHCCLICCIYAIVCWEIYSMYDRINGLKVEEMIISF